MTPILVILVNSAVGIFLSGLYFAMGVRIWQRRGKIAAMLSFATVLLYAIPTAVFVWGAIRGAPRATISIYGLLLLILPAIIAFQVLGWSWRAEADADTIIKDLESA